MRTFSVQRRADLGTPQAREPQYEYLDRSARVEAFAVRRLVRQWLRRYPAHHREEWRSRFTSGLELDYYSAFWELYPFTYFSRLRFEIEVAPGSQRGPVKAPDFLMRRGDLAFYLEATTAHDLGESERRVRRWKADVRGAINAIRSRDFFVTLDWEVDPTSQTVSASPANAVDSWLTRLDYAQVYTAFHEHTSELPLLRLETGGGRLRVSPVPKTHRRMTRGLIAAEGLGLRQVNVLKALRTSMRQKRNRYGDLDLPYIVAVNVLTNVAGEDEFVDALFGTPQVVVTADGASAVHHGTDGAYGTAKHPRAKRVSAVLCVRDLYPWAIGQGRGPRVLRLIHHPWSARPLPSGILGISEYVLGDEFSDGEAARQRLGLR